MIVHNDWVYIANPRTGTQSVHKALKDIGNHSWLPHHAKANEIIQGKHKKLITKWEDRFTFCFIRNPFSYWVSHYHRSDSWSGQGISFEEMILGHDETDSQHYYFADKGNLLVSHLSRFENLPQEWEYIKYKINVENDLPHIHKSNHKPHMDYYNAKTKFHVEQQFKEDFEWWIKAGTHAGNK